MKHRPFAKSPFRNENDWVLEKDAASREVDSNSGLSEIPFDKSAKRLIALAASSILAVSCANQGGDDYDALGYDFDDYGSPDGNVYQEVNPIYDSTPAFQETRPAAPRPTTPSRPAAVTPAQTTHTVVRGDTLWGLGKKYQVSVDAIKRANNLQGDKIVVGKTLKIPAR